MKILQLDINNFLSIDKMSLLLDRPGLTLILGQNKDAKQYDSNGSGKSSIWHALSFCLYGETLREVSVDDLIRTGQKRMSVTAIVDPEDGSSKLTITRQREGKKSTLTAVTESGTDCFPSNSVTDMQTPLNEWLGLDFKTFVNSVYFGSRLTKFFMSGTDADRKELLDNILKIESFDDVLTKAKTALRTLENEALRLDGEVKYLTKILAEKREQVDQTSTLYERSKKELDIFEEDYVSSVSSINKKKEDLNKNLKLNEDSLYEYNEDLRKEKPIVEKYDSLKRYAKEAYDNSIISLKMESKEKRAKLNKKYDILIEEKEVELKELDEVLSKAKDRKLKLSDNKIELTTAYNLDKKQITHFNDLLKLSLCPTCSQSVNSAFIHESIEEVEHKCDKTLQLLEEVKSLYSKASAECNDADNAALSVAQVISELHQGRDKELNNITSLYTSKESEEYKNYRDLLSDIDFKKNGELSTFKIDCMRQIEETKRSINSIVNEISSLDKDLSLLSMEFKAKEMACKRHEEQLLDFEKVVDNYEHQLTTNSIKYDKVIKEKELVSFWVEGFGPRGIKSFIFEAALPYLTERANYYSTILTGGSIKIEILPTTTAKTTGITKEKLNVTAKNLFGADIYQGNSEGEKARINICILLAIQDLLATRSTRTWNITIFDEILDSLDPVGTEYVISLFREISENKSVYIISHNSSIKQHFDECLTISKQGGITRLLD